MLEGRKVSFKGVREFVEREMQEEMRTGVVKPIQEVVERSPDERALFIYMLHHIDGGVSRWDILDNMERQYNQKFDVKSLLERLEVHYDAILAGTEVCNYRGGLYDMLRDMDKLQKMNFNK